MTRREREIMDALAAGWLLRWDPVKGPALYRQQYGSPAVNLESRGVAAAAVRRLVETGHLRVVIAAVVVPVDKRPREVDRTAGQRDGAAAIVNGPPGP